MQKLLAYPFVLARPAKAPQGGKLSAERAGWMKKLLNTLYVTSQGSYLSKDGECIVIRSEEGEKKRFPIHILEGVICFGNVLCSPFLLGHCAEKGLSVSFLTERGRYLAAVNGPQSGNVILRREQYRSTAGFADHLWIGLTACFRLFTHCWPTMFAPP
jgi:hypothetical protein